MDINTNVQFSNVITPPDIVKSILHTVVIIDPTGSDIDDLVLYLNVSPNAYTVYLYRGDMNDHQWLADAMASAVAYIVNTDQSSFSAIKDKIAVDKKAWYYGPKNFLMNGNRLDKPIDYFVQQDQPK